MRAARDEKRWFIATIALALFQVVAIAGLKAASGNIVDIFYRDLTKRAAQKAFQATLPVCLKLDDPATFDGAGMFGFGGYEAWLAPGRFIINNVAGVSYVFAQAPKEFAVEIQGLAFVQPARPQVRYEIAVNGQVLDAGVLDAASPRLDKRLTVPAPAKADAPFLLEMRMPGVASLRALGVSLDPEWRKMGLSVQAIRIATRDGPQCLN